MRVIKFPKMEHTEYIGQDGFMLQWCCSCKLRHIWHFHIIRGKKPDDDYIVMSGISDRTATKLRKAYEKGKKCLK